jgi:hypothetical protein
MPFDVDEGELHTNPDQISIGGQALTTALNNEPAAPATPVEEASAERAASGKSERGIIVQTARHAESRRGFERRGSAALEFDGGHPARWQIV